MSDPGDFIVRDQHITEPLYYEGEEVMVENLRRGIAAYAEQQATLLDVIRQYGGRLTQDEFDDEFANFGHIEEIRDGKRWRIPIMGGKHPWRAFLMDDDTILLGSMTQGQWSKWLDLLQIMVRLGDVKRTIEDGKAMYAA